MATGFIMLDNRRPDPQQGVFPRRGGHRPSGTCIVHTSEGNWRNGVDALTRLILTRADYGAYHQGCDWADIARYYPWSWECWQDSETNNWAVGISAACKTTDWATMPADIAEGFYRNMARMAADFVRWMKATYNVDVPLRRISGAEARARVPGFCAHGDSGIARSDPGRDFDWTRFFHYTRQELTGTEDFLMALTHDQQVALYNVLCTNEGRNVLGDHLADRLLKRDVKWFGYDGREQPAGKRSTITLADLAGWFDHAIVNLAGRVQGVKELVEAGPVAKVDLDPEQLDSLAAQLREGLGGEVANELARRLAE